MSTSVLERVKTETTNGVAILEGGLGPDFYNDPILEYCDEHPEMIGEPLIGFLRRDISPIGYVFRSSKKVMGNISDYTIDEKGLYQGRDGFRLMLLDSGEIAEEPTYINVRSGDCLLDRCIGLDIISDYSGNVLDLEKCKLKYFEPIVVREREKSPEEKELSDWLNGLMVRYSNGSVI
ncbi:hypothetical protein HOE04_04630 [archaeon]|jgi:hypothetical protein|nr:hypothetical protein [archaeon]